jgi:hypothetical protein
MKPVRLMSAGVLLLLLGAAVPAYARQDDAKPPKQEQEAKPVKQQEAKPEKQQEQAKPAKQQEAKPAKQQEEAKPVKQQETKPARQEQPAKTQLKQVKATSQDQQAKSQPQGQWARNGQKDSRGHEYNESKFGRDHHTRFAATGGRMYNGRREYSYGGYWFYAGAYPAWFYQQDAYFIMGADGLWYAVAYGNPSLTFQVNIE